MKLEYRRRILRTMAEEHNKGPDQIKAADSYWTSDPEGAVKLRITEDGPSARPPVSVPGLLMKVAEEYGDRPALCSKVNDEWETITYRQYKEKVHHMAKVFIKLGLRQRHTVCILGFNSKEWFIADLAAITAGGIAAGVYPTNSADATHHILIDSRTDILVVDELKQYQKILTIRDKLPNLKAIIQIDGPFGEPAEGYFHWSDLEEMDVSEYDNELENRLSRIAVNECCLLVYTSGTVGTPKGVMLSHDNLTYNAFLAGDYLDGGIKMGEEVMVSYLPLSHIAAQIVDIYGSLLFAITVYFADRDALKGSLVRTLQEARPTRMLGVPRVYEKIQEKFLSVEKQNGYVKKVLMDWAKRHALQHHMDCMNGTPTNYWQYRLAQTFVWSKVKSTMGLDRCMTLGVGAAPISKDTKKYFMSLDMPLTEIFGMSETTGNHTISPQLNYNFDSVGKTLPSYETKIINPDENGNGEILMRGRNSFMGYINELEKTKEGLDDEGWVHSGDIGRIDDNGFLYITGRIKELLVTAGGENIPPVHIESLVKSELPVLSNAMLIGDQKKFLSMLVTLRTRLNPETGGPTDDLHLVVVQWLKQLGLDYTKVSEIIAAGPDPKVLKAIEDGIARANKKAISNAQKVQKFAILPRDFSMTTGELGPTLKLKRNVVIQTYHDIIENFYKG